jgi:hypothetical protein
MGKTLLRGHDAAMTSPDPLNEAGSALVDRARALQRAAERQGSHLGAPAALEALQVALELLSGAWYRLAADASSDGLSREQDPRVVAAMHDVAAALARSARVCREGRATVQPILPRNGHTQPADGGHSDGDASWFASRRSPIRRVA